MEGVVGKPMLFTGSDLRRTMSTSTRVARKEEGYRRIEQKPMPSSMFPGGQANNKRVRFRVSYILA